MTSSRRSSALLLTACTAAALALPAQERAGPETLRWLTHSADPFPAAAHTSRLARPGPDGRLVYTADDQGQTLPDFSSCGFGGGGVPLPAVPTVVTLTPVPGEGDDRARIQAAIDEVARRKPDAQGLRGAVLLRRGTYRVGDTLRITSSGVVLRGEGPGPDGTVLIATRRERHTAIEVAGSGRAEPIESTRRRVTDARVPAGARSFSVDDAAGFRPGDRVIVHRPSTAEWLAELRMDRLSKDYPKPGTRDWQPGGFDLRSDRFIVAVDGHRLTLDAPLFQSLDDRFGGGTVAKYRDDGRIERVGVEELRLVSVYDSAPRSARGNLTPAQRVRELDDESHAWHGVVLDRLRHGWVSRVTVLHTGYGAVHCGVDAIYTTVQDCAHVDPVSQHTGGRKYSFGANGQHGLFLRCYVRNGRHDFVLGNRLAGPNVFLDCLAEEASAASEPHHRYGTGGLWDNVRLVGVAELQSVNRGDSGSGHGWAGANCVFWNCEAPMIVVLRPPTAQNYAIGWIGGTDPASLATGRRFAERLQRMGERARRPFPIGDVPLFGDGHIESPAAPVAPRSLYLAQLRDRLGPAAVAVVTRPTPGPSL